MAKPIFLIELPDFGKHIEHEKLGDGIKGELSNEYHILIIINPLLIEVKFQAFYEKDFDEVKFEELKQIIKDKINEATL